ncbi:MAG: hypothetical protein AAGL49_05490 [Pseudomonadota bacterium]
MRRGHRRAHLIMWIVLAPLTAAGLFLALSARKADPVEPYAPPLSASEEAG